MLLNEEKYQTPLEVVKYMVGMLPEGLKTILEPTPGLGRIVKCLTDHGYQVASPDDYFHLDKSQRFDGIVMNPPFSERTSIMDNAPSYYSRKGMKIGYEILLECMQMSDHVIALMPWFTLIDSDHRMKAIKEHGLKSITHLPRKTFGYARIQTCILEIERGVVGEIIFKTFNY